MKKAIIFSNISNRDSGLQTFFLSRFSLEAEFYASFDSREAIIDELNSYAFAIFLLESVNDQMGYFLGVCDALKIKCIIFLKNNSVMSRVISNRLISYVDFDNSDWYFSQSVEIAMSSSLGEKTLLDPGVKLAVSQNNRESEFFYRRLETLRNRMAHSKNDAEMEMILGEIFGICGVVFNRNFKIENSKLRPDFMVWSSDIEYIIGNPIIIEVKNRRPRSEDIYQINKYVELSGSSAGILLYREDHISQKPIEVDDNHIGARDILEFIDNIRAVDLKNAILNCFR